MFAKTEPLLNDARSNSSAAYSKNLGTAKPLLNDAGSNSSAVCSKDLGTINIAYAALNGLGRIDLAEILGGHATTDVMQDGTGSVVLPNRTDKQRVVLFTRHG